MRILSIAVATFAIAVSAAAATELAKIQDKVITLEDFNSHYKQSARFFSFKAPTKKNVLEDLIKRDVGVMEAKKMGLEKDPEVQERINNVLYQSLLDKKVGSKLNDVKISDKEVADYYKKNPEIRTSHIFVQVRVDANQAQEKAAYERIKKIKEILDEQLKNGKTFAEVAAQYSEGVERTTGGDINYQTKDRLDPTYYETAVKLSVGGMSQIIRSQFGYHIVKLTSVKEFRDIDKGQYTRMLFDEKRAKLFDEYLDGLKKQYKVSVNYDLLK